VEAMFASDLKERFDWALYLNLEAYEVLPDGRSFVRSDEAEREIGIFESLHGSVEKIPPALLATAEALRLTTPDLFEAALMRRVQLVGSDFSPVSATEFVEVLNRDVQSEGAHRVSTEPSGSLGTGS
jgi:hypothetical protein